MIHHLARAFAIRQQTGLVGTLAESGHPARPSAPVPVRPRPITPWGSPARPSAASTSTRASAHTPPHVTPRLRISADPHDARRT
ncbi:MAG: hypothetical protein WAP57_17430, partial [Aquabacterium commune]